MEFDKEFLDKLFEQAKENPRLRQNFDLRTSPADTSQRTRYFRVQLCPFIGMKILPKQ